jgi:hypothetical protein
MQNAVSVQGLSKVSVCHPEYQMACGPVAWRKTASLSMRMVAQASSLRADSKPALLWFVS